MARPDGRVAAQLRPFLAEPAALTRADGSARWAHGQTECLASVYGPCEAKRAREKISSATLEVIVRPLSGLPGPVEREAEQLLGQTLEHVVLTHLHPRIEPRQVSAYRLHTLDPVTFSSGFVMRWRNGFYESGKYAPAQTDLSAAVWVYEWPAAR